MKKALKITGKVLLGLLILIVLLLVIMAVYNQIMLRKNKSLYETPLGQLVEVDGHNMSIYTEGEGEHTIVFLSGWGTSSPILDFKPLYSRLSDEYRIAVVEKFGYGFSDVVDGERDMDTILRQDREALEKVGIKAPYVLCPHSLSGYEATLWAQKYPDEVEAIENGYGEAEYYTKRIKASIDSILEQVRSSDAHMIILSDDVGWGVRPWDEKSRLIQTAIGNLNRYIDQIADEVNIVERGIARHIK